MDLRVDFAKILESFEKRLYTVEQIATSPAVMGGTGGGVQTNEFPDGIIVGQDEVIDTTPPDAATALTVTVGTFYDSVYADAEWTHPATGRQPVSYDIELTRRTGIDPNYVWTLERIESTAATNYRFENLRPNTTYRVRVMGRSNIGIGLNWTAHTEFTTGIDTTIPTTPTGVVTARGATSLIVKWNTVADVDVALGEGLYEVEIDTSTAFNTANKQSAVTSASILAFNDLTGSQATWYARVRAIDSSGNVSGWSANSSVFTGGIVESMIVGDFSAAKITYGSMSGDRITTNTLTANHLASSTLTSREITLGSGGALKINNPPTNGIFINSQGIRAYQNSVQQFSLDASGTAIFSGTVSAAQITGGTIEGAVYRSNSGYPRVEMLTTATLTNVIFFRNASGESISAQIASNSTDLTIMSGRRSLSDAFYSQITLVKNTSAGAGGIGMYLYPDAGSNISPYQGSGIKVVRHGLNVDGPSTFWSNVNVGSLSAGSSGSISGGPITSNSPTGTVTLQDGGVNCPNFSGISGVALVNGAVGAPWTYNNSVVGRDVYVNSAGTLGYNGSSITIKKNVRKISDKKSSDLAKRILDLDLVSFIYKDDEDNQPQVGFIAEWAEETLGDAAPTFLYYSQEGVVEGVNYQKLLVALIPMMRKMAQKLELV